MSFTMIQTDQELRNLRKYFADKPITTVAMDFEGEFNLHCYGEHLCLIQIFDGNDSYIVDALKISPVELKATLETDTLAKLFFGASSDFSLVYKKFGIRMTGVLDLQCSVEALNLPGKGLDSVLSEILGISPSSSKKRFQMQNWMHRPIHKDALEYALGDVIHLFALRDALDARIAAAGLQDRLALCVKSAQPSFNYDPTPRIYRTPEFRDLNRRGQEILKAVFQWRDGAAQILNCSPENLLRKSNLFSLARNPESVKTLKPNNELTPRLLLELQGVLKKVGV